MCLITHAVARLSPDVLRSKYQELTTHDETARRFTADPENPQAKVIPFRSKVKRRKAE